ncbi:MAG: hypothetical protein CHACPFDD_03843 [Phycisphaerae bacterium]|nr:hypothetical protein [Phycisphaerae bacterium]
MRVVYILSPGHSGSTLLGLLLGAHPAVATAGELKFVPPGYREGHTCSCGVRMEQCDFWRAVAEQLRQRGFELDDARFCTHLSDARRLVRKLIAGQVRSWPFEAVRRVLLSVLPRLRATWAHTLRCNEALMHAICDVTAGGRSAERAAAAVTSAATAQALEAQSGGAGHAPRGAIGLLEPEEPADAGGAAVPCVFLDTSKDASRLRYLHESGRFDIYVLHLLRDGRAVAYSMIKKGTPARLAADDWVREHRQAWRLRPRFPADRWLAVRYEELCSSPRETMAAICRFVGIAPELAQTDYRGWDSHVLGNRMRLSPGKDIRLDESWRSGLLGPDLRTVERVTRAYNRVLGYVD